MTRQRARHAVHAKSKWREYKSDKHSRGPEVDRLQPVVPLRQGLERHTFVIDDGHLAQLKRFAYLETSFHTYATSIGCTFIHDEIIATEQQANLIRSWWEEHRL
jgi:hypothetical protein